MTLWYKFTLEPPLDPLTYDAILDIPGAGIRGYDVTAAANAAWLVEEALVARQKRFTFRIEDRLPKGLLSGGADLRYLIPAGFREKSAEMALPYQREGIQWCAQRAGSAMWHSPGSGKTFSAIAWALHSKPPYIIVTKAAARHQFAGEIKNFTTLRPVVIEGAGEVDFNALAARSHERGVMVAAPDERKRRRRRGWEYEADNAPLGSVAFFVLGWEILPYHAAALTKLRASAVVFDELHRAKSTRRIKASIDEDGKLQFEKRNNVASAAMDVARGVPRRLGTTATPVKDRVRDLWAQMDLLEPFGWGPFWRVERDPNGTEGRPLGFAFRYCSGHAGTFGGVDSSGQSHLDELDARLTFVSHIVPRSITHRDLPPKRRMVTWIPPSEQSTPPPEFKKILKEAAKIGGTALLEAQFQEAAARKRKFVLDHLVSALEGDQKVVVLTGRHKDCESLGADLKKACDKQDISPKAFIVSHGGNTTTNKRNELMLEYMRAEGPAVIVGTLDAWGESVNLQDTDLAAFVMLPYTPSMLEQAEGRFTRHGQKRPVTIQYFVAEGTADDRVASILLDKLPAVARMGINTEADEMADGLAGLGSDQDVIASLLGKITSVVEEGDEYE